MGTEFGSSLFGTGVVDCLTCSFMQPDDVVSSIEVTPKWCRAHEVDTGCVKAESGQES